MPSWPETFKQMCRKASTPGESVTLLSNRARALVRSYARQDAQGRHQYAGPALIDKLADDMREEMQREYDFELQRDVRLKEVFNG